MEDKEPMSANSNDQDKTVSVKNWLLTIFLSAIPLLNLLLWFIWAFSTDQPPSKRNWAKAMLISAVVVALVMVLFFGVLFGAILSFFNQINEVQMGV